MKDFHTQLSAATFFALSLQCHAAGLGVASEVLTNESPIYSPPMGCSFPVMTIPDYGRPPRQPVAQKLIPPFNATADVPVGPTRTVRFEYHFSGLQDILPPLLHGDFKISSTKVTVYKGPSNSYPKASLDTFKRQPGTGDILVSKTRSVGEVRPFQNQWLIRVTSKGKLHDAGKTVRSATLTLLCDMQIAETPSPVPTLTQ